MSHTRLLGAGAVALVAALGVAHAADLGLPAPDYVPPPIAPAYYNWTGAQAGLLLGYGWGDSEPAGVLTGTDDADGFLAGGYIGYNWHFPSNWVLGAEADLLWADLDDAGYELNWYSTFRGKVGFAVNRFMFFGTGGVAIGDVETPSTGDGTEVGWTAGGGVDMALTDNVIGRLEYQYIDLGDVDDAGTDFDAHTVRVGIGFRF